MVIAKSDIKAWADLTCEQKYLQIVWAVSPLSQDEFRAKLSSDPSFAQVGITAGKCDREVRRRINNEIRTPAGKDRLPPGSITPSKKIGAIMVRTCS